MNARLSSAASLILHIVLLAILSMIALHPQKPVPPLPVGMEIEITDFEHAMPLPDPTLAQSDSAESRTMPEASSPAPVDLRSSEPPQPQPPSPVPEPAPQPVVPAPAVPRESLAPPKVEIAPVLAPAPVMPTPPVPVAMTAPPVPQAPVPQAIPASPAPAAAAAPAAPPQRRLDPTALSRSLAARTGAAPRSRLNSAAIGSVIGQAVPKGVAGLTVRQRANLVDMIRSQITPCWNPPVADDKSGHVTVLMRIRLDRVGGVMGVPAVSRMTGRTAANEAYANALSSSVRRAVLRCAPLKLPPELYDAWADVELNFDPKDVS